MATKIELSRLSAVAERVWKGAMKECRFRQIDAFTTERFQDNPAKPVASAHGATDAQIQAIAREENSSDAATGYVRVARADGRELSR